MPERPACAYCRRRPADPRWRPFCSERCKMADLGRWLREDYRVPGEPDDAWNGLSEGERPPDDE
jgi:hypothetical protein